MTRTLHVILTALNAHHHSTRRHPMYPTLFTTPGVKAFAEAIDDERQAQLAKWGEQHHPDGTGLAYYVEAARVARRDCQYAADSAKGTRWALILLEEVYEALAESDPAKLRAELVQSGAVIAAWISDLDSRTEPGPADA